ncbi:hypothetical protein LEC33_26035 [Salmonella enterica]|nr:hypothetical protein [Salmonella enterica]MDJ7049590.1 hypothetical protein [Salmonella enterica]MDJ7338945.1 hypothetical protein [Salmonella enterica]
MNLEGAGIVSMVTLMLFMLFALVFMQLPSAGRPLLSTAGDGFFPAT